MMIVLSCMVKTGGKFRTWLKMPTVFISSPYCFVGSGGNFRNNSRCQLGSYVQRIVLWKKYAKCLNVLTLTQCQLCSYFQPVVLYGKAGWQLKLNMSTAFICWSYILLWDIYNILQQWLNSTHQLRLCWTLCVVGCKFKTVTQLNMSTFYIWWMYIAL